MKYLAFDIEIAFDFSHISMDLFPPDDGERVMVVKDIVNEDGDKEEVWLEAKYIGNIIKRFRLSDGELVKATHWKYQGSDWKRFRPLGITCAAATSSDGGLWNWYAHDEMGKFTDRMSQSQCQDVANSLLLLAEDYTILTWNGIGFDFDILYEEANFPRIKGMDNSLQKCKALALNHVDMMFHFFTSKGYLLGLDAAAKGMGLPGKPEGMDGAIAPALWAKKEYHRILDYVSWDVKNTLALAQAVDESGCLDWIAHSGCHNSWFCEKWLTVKEAIALPEPDTSWRSKFYGWTDYEPPKFSAAPLLIPWDPDYDETEEEKQKEVKGE